MTESSAVLEYARSYHQAGLTVLPIAEGAKAPPPGFRKAEFLEKPQRAEDLPAIFAKNGLNIGVYGGAVSHNLVVLDIDSREKWRDLDNIAVFRKLKANTPIVSTRRGFHAYLFAPFPCGSTKADRWNADILAEGRHAVAPPSEVRKGPGGSVQLYLFSDGQMRPIYAPPKDEFSALADIFGFHPAITPKQDILTDLEAGSFGFFYGLGPRAWEAITVPQSKGKRSEAEHWTVFRAASIGWSFADVHALFYRHAAPGTKFREKEKAGYGEKWLLKGYGRALSYLANVLTPSDILRNTAIELLAQETPFSGRGRYTDAAVLQAILKIERRAGKRPARMSIRLLAEMTLSSVSTVHDSLSRLQESGAVRMFVDNKEGLILESMDAFLESSLLAKPNNIITFSLDIRDIKGSLLKASKKVRANAQAPAVSLPAEHDAFNRAGLGSTGPHLIMALNSFSGAPFCVSDLMKKGFAFRYVRKALDLLQTAGVVAPAGHKKLQHGKPVPLFVACGKLSFQALDDIAKAAGTAGAGEKQKERHRQDREALRLWKQREGRLS